MIMEHLPNKAYQLAAEYELGEPVRMYKTDKRSAFKTFGCAMSATYLLVAFIVVAADHFHLEARDALAYAILAGILLIMTLIIFIPLALWRPTTIYICADGFIWHRKSRYRTVLWEEVEWVLTGESGTVIYLVNKEHLALNQFFARRLEASKEIELKARLAQRLGGAGNLEREYERAIADQAARQREEEVPSVKKRSSPVREKAEEAFRLQGEYQLGEFRGTYRAGLSGIFRNEILARTIYYMFLLAVLLSIAPLFGILSLIPGLSSFPIVSFVASNSGIIAILIGVLPLFFMPRFFARFTRLHLYADGFIYLTGHSLEVVRWEQIEKLVYRKPTPVIAMPFCHIYLTNNRNLEISGYMHKKDVIKRIFNEHVKNTVEVGSAKPEV